MSTITVHHLWDPRRGWAGRWHWFVDSTGYRTRHGYAPWRWLALAAARRCASRRDRAWARHEAARAREIRSVTS
jgi:hypothetical protein